MTTYHQRIFRTDETAEEYFASVASYAAHAVSLATRDANFDDDNDFAWLHDEGNDVVDCASDEVFRACETAYYAIHGEGIATTLAHTKNPDAFNEDGPRSGPLDIVLRDAATAAFEADVRDALDEAVETLRALHPADDMIGPRMPGRRFYLRAP